jgi:hypothetical protein
MTRTLTVVFDGEVLRPDDTLDLKPNARYRVTVEDEVEIVETQSAWEVLEQLAGTVDAPADWAAEHDHYLYGSPKRGNGSES